MRAAVFAYSRRGCGTAVKVAECFPDDEVRAYTVKRLSGGGFDAIGSPSRQFYGGIFGWADVMVFVGSCGIAVREIAPHVKDKKTDPAVIVIDELGRFVISLLSGHIGGGNAIARKLAEKLGAVPVITTATDINGRFSVDTWATENGYAISDMKAAKAVSARILETDVPLLCEFPVATALPPGLFEAGSGDIGIYIGCMRREPFDTTLRLIPKVLHVGIGCRKGVSAEDIENCVSAVFEQNGLDIRAVGTAASIDLKADEPGLLEYCAGRGWPLVFHSAEELNGVPGEFAGSEFVRNVTGVDNVCERASMIGADELIVGKTAANGVTVAVAMEKTEVRFG